MRFGKAPAWMVAAVCVWIAFDISRGALTGVSNAKQHQLDETPLSDAIEDTVAALQSDVGENWSEHTTISSVDSRDNTIEFKLVLTSETEAAIEPRWARNRIIGVRHDIREAACKHKRLEYILGRGGSIRFVSADGRGATVFPEELRPFGC